MSEAVILDALKGLTKRQMEDLAAALAKELQECVLCGTEGAEFYLVRPRRREAGERATMLFCVPCFEKHRLPESRAKGVLAP